jgi:GH24 family phage-related lysozyme (muramidase)
VQADLWLTPRVDRHWRQRLKLKCDEPLSDFAFNCNLRRYGTEQMLERITARLSEKAGLVQVENSVTSA